MNIKNEHKEGNTVFERVDRIAFFKLLNSAFFSNLITLLSMREVMGY